MKISNLIHILSKILVEDGDLPVSIFANDTFMDAQEPEVVDVPMNGKVLVLDLWELNKLDEDMPKEKSKTFKLIKTEKCVDSEPQEYDIPSEAIQRAVSRDMERLSALSKEELLQHVELVIDMTNFKIQNPKED